MTHRGASPLRAGHRRGRRRRAASFAIPATLAYDPWAWLVWGREVGHLDLATTGGPSWKPLPRAPGHVGGTLRRRCADGVARARSRALSLVSLAGVFQLARRLSGSVVAGLVAAGLVVFTPDHGPRFLRTVLEGHTAPLTAGLAAWAVERHLAGRHTTTFWLLVALALDRPEAWPFLGAYALWAWRTEHVRTAALGVGLALVPVLWFGGDWWGAGSPLHGAEPAQDVPDSFQTVAALDRAVRRSSPRCGSRRWRARRCGCGAGRRTAPRGRRPHRPGAGVDGDGRADERRLRLRGALALLAPCRRPACAGGGVGAGGAAVARRGAPRSPSRSSCAGSRGGTLRRADGRARPARAGSTAIDGRGRAVPLPVR